MRKRNRMISVVMMIVLLCGCFMGIAGCANGVQKNSILDPKNPVKVIVWHYYNGIQQNSFNALVDQFNATAGAEQGIIVEAHSYGSVEELASNLKDAVNGKIGTPQCPDIFSAYKDTAYDFDQQGYMVDLSDYFSSEELGAFVEDYLQSSYIFDRSVKLLPVVKSTEQLFLNATDWEKFSKETGVAESNLATWEGIAAVSQLYYQWSGGKAFFGRDAIVNYILVGCAQLENEFMTVDANGTVSYHFEKETIKKLWDNYYIPYVKGYYTAVGKFRSDDMKTGKLLACVASSSSANYIPQSVTLESGETYEINIKVLPTPGFEGYAPYAIQQGAGMGVLKSDEQHEYAACTFLKWFTASEQNCVFSNASGYLPVEKEADMGQFLEQSQSLTTSQKALQVGMDMMEEYHYYETPVFAQADALRSTLSDVLSSQCSMDRNAVELAMESGIAYEEAIAVYLTEEYFDRWYDNFYSTVTDIK